MVGIQKYINQKSYGSVKRCFKCIEKYYEMNASRSRIKQELTDVELEHLRYYSSKETIKRYSNFKTELWPQERRAIEKYFIKEGGYVLDIGCGTGRTTYPLYKLGLDV